MITVVYRCPRCNSRWVDAREGLGRSESAAGAESPTSGPEAPQRPRLEERLCRACERAEERLLWDRVPAGRGREDEDEGSL